MKGWPAPMKFDHLQGGKLGDKISLSDYFYVQFKTLAYLFRTAPSKTLILTTSLVIRSFYEFVSLKYLKATPHEDEAVEKFTKK